MSRGTEVTHPITGQLYPLILSAATAGESVGLTPEAIIRLAEDGEVAAAPHEPFGQWRIYTLPLWTKFGLTADSVPASSTHEPPATRGNLFGFVSPSERSAS